MLVLSQAPFVVINYGAAVRVFRQEITSIQDKILFYYVHCTRTRCTVHYLCAILISIFDLTKAAAAQIVHINLDSSFRTGRQDVCIIPVKKSCSHFFTSIFFFRFDAARELQFQHNSILINFLQTHAKRTAPKTNLIISISVIGEEFVCRNCVLCVQWHQTKILIQYFFFFCCCSMHFLHCIVTLAYFIELHTRTATVVDLMISRGSTF